MSGTSNAPQTDAKGRRKLQQEIEAGKRRIEDERRLKMEDMDFGKSQRFTRVRVKAGLPQPFGFPLSQPENRASKDSLSLVEAEEMAVRLEEQRRLEEELDAARRPI